MKRIDKNPLETNNVLSHHPPTPSGQNIANLNNDRKTAVVITFYCTLPDKTVSPLLKCVIICPMTTIILVRHGENEWVKKQLLAGWTPGVHLNEVGHQQAEQAAQRLATVPIQAIYSSPLERCRETAEYIAATHELPITTLTELGEVRYGEWQGAKVAELAKEKRWFAVQFFPSRVRFPEGEALREVQFRAVQTLEMLSSQHEKETIVVVSHADWIKLVLAYYLGVHIDLFQRLVISPASISAISLSSNGSVQILRLNDDGPFKPPAAEEEKKET